MDENIQAHNIDVHRTKDVLIDENVSFQSMFLSPKCLQGLDKCGFQKPSPIQLKAIPLGRCGFDLIVKSKSGTGKTIVFSMVALESLDLSISGPQVLVLAPTREIAVQIANTLTAIGKYFEGLQVNSFIGGFPEKDDKEKAQNCHIAVGAPGRVRSLIEKNILNVSTVKLFVLDEADKLMEKSFLQDVNEIYQRLPHKKQIIATSATYPNNLDDFLSKYMQCPTYVSSENDTQLLLGLKHFVKEVKPSTNTAQQIKLKNEELNKLLSKIPFTQCIIFSNYQTRAENISISLNRSGWETMFISAAQNQKKRLETMNKLKNFKCRILLSTDLTARGIDASNVDLVINYDVPLDVSTYLHRMGRAGRYGSKGVCISLISGEKDLLQIRKFLGNIGGSNLTIAKLGEMKNETNLWSLDNTTNLETISGIVDDNEDALEAIKNEIFSLKNIEDNICQNKKNSTDEKVKIASNEKEIEPETRIDELTENESNKKCDTSETAIDSTLCLEALAKGTFNFEGIPSPPKMFSEEVEGISFENLSGNLVPDGSNKDRENDSNDSALKLLVKGTFDFSNVSSAESGSERLGNLKESENTTSSDTEMKDSSESDEKCGRTRKSSVLENNTHSKISKNEVFVKNKGVYEVARILSNTTDLNADTEESLDNYLKLLNKETNTETPAKSEESHFGKNATEKKTDSLFTTVYLCAIEKEKNDWKKIVNYEDFLKDQERKKSEQTTKINLLQADDEDYDEDEEMDEDMDEDEYEEEEEYVEDQPAVEYDENGYEYIPNRMVWVPVEEDISKVSSQIPRINLLDEDDHPNPSVSQPHQEPINTHYNYSHVSQPHQEPINTHYNYSRVSQPYQKPIDTHYNYSQNFPTAQVPQFEQPTIGPHSYWDHHYADCFYLCQTELWTRGSTFKTAEEFKQWYVHSWQKKLDEVREYVKQNIYVREMTEYQRNFKRYHPYS